MNSGESRFKIDRDCGKILNQWIGADRIFQIVRGSIIINISQSEDLEISGDGAFEGIGDSVRVGVELGPFSDKCRGFQRELGDPGEICVPTV